MKREAQSPLQRDDCGIRAVSGCQRFVTNADQDPHGETSRARSFASETSSVVCSARSSAGETILHGRLAEVRILSHNRKGLSVTPSAPLAGESRARRREHVSRVLSSRLSPFSHLLSPAFALLSRFAREGFHGQFGRT